MNVTIPGSRLASPTKAHGGARAPSTTTQSPRGDVLALSRRDGSAAVTKPVSTLQRLEPVSKFVQAAGIAAVIFGGALFLTFGALGLATIGMAWGTVAVAGAVAAVAGTLMRAASRRA